MPKTLNRAARRQAKREEFLAQRKLGVGGSDIASVMNEGYGCRLRLWRDKRDEVPDYPREENDVMEIGRRLEGFFARKYAKEAGRTVVTRRRPVVHPEFPELRVNIDREIMPAENGEDEGESGVLEIKSVGRGMFYKVKREGLSHDYILQLQHGMLCLGTTWGAFAIGCRDNGDLLHWDVQRDPDVIEEIIREARAFWREVKTGQMPPRLEPDDPRCQKCEYRKSCQGNALIQIIISERGEVERDERLAPLVRELKERQALLAQATALVDETKEELKTKLGKREAVIADASTMYYRPQVAMRGDFKGLAAEYDRLRKQILALTELPDVRAEFEREYPPSDSDAFRKPTPSRPFRLF